MRRLDDHVGQVRPAVQAEQLDRLLAPMFQDQTHGVGFRGADVQGVVDRLAQLAWTGMLQQPQHLDELASPLARPLRLQTPPQDPETLRQVPMLQRLGEVQSARFPLQKGLPPLSPWKIAKLSKAPHNQSSRRMTRHCGQCVGPVPVADPERRRLCVSSRWCRHGWIGGDVGSELSLPADIDREALSINALQAS